ncbi:hypothetical protein FA95DRAFT_1533560 [Auriscalpium vulgare]|uniref:Uncharacterized protein n=1 Tax=Auriscalpium vulgare TaxID=40419 RepID=A0ACB8S6C2_9AGAM|nr:hypothetical protein FA95DRAFT_1533560 [Auriscalpium vulgare]
MVEGTSASTDAPPSVAVGAESKIYEVEMKDNSVKKGVDEDQTEILDDEESETEDLEEPIQVSRTRRHLARLSNRARLQDALRDVLDTSFIFDGTYAARSTYYPAHNPGLVVDGFGIVGLPLNPAEATRLRSFCSDAPFGNGERTVVNKAVRDTWELDPYRVRFTNPAWEPWLHATVVKDLCTSLGVSQAVKCEFYKMLLYEEGSHFLAHQDTEKANGMVATVVLVLPSTFQGGQVHVSHGAQHEVFDTAANSAFGTTALAWYTDVVHEVKPLTSGFRLALSYNIIHAGPSMPPRIPTADKAIAALERVLSAWRQADYRGEEPDGGAPPQKLAYLLDHRYSHANLSFDKLKGSDASLVHAVREVSDRVDFRIALGSLRYTAFGTGEDNGPPPRRGRWGYDKYDNEYGADRDVEMGDIHARSCTVQLISGPNGEHLESATTLEMEELMVDEDYFDEDSPDGQEYEGYQGNCAGSLEYFYHRTVLLIWPGSQNVEVITSLGGRDAAVASLKATTSLSPSQNDLELADIALHKGGVDAGSLVAGFAVRWHDAQLWRKAAASCRAASDVGVLGEAHLVDAYKALGFKNVVDIVEQTLTNSMSTSMRLGLISAIKSQPPSGDAILNAPSKWITAKRFQILSTLKRPKAQDMDPIIINSWSLGGSRILQDVVLPQLASFRLQLNWWQAFIRKIQVKEAGPDENRFTGWPEPVFALAKPTLEKSLTRIASNVERVNFIEKVEALASSEAIFVDWCADRRAWAIQSLAVPSVTDIPLFIQLQKKDLVFLETTLVSKLQRVPFAVNFWKSLLEQFTLLFNESRATLPDRWRELLLDTLREPLRHHLQSLTTNRERLEVLEHITCATVLAQQAFSDFVAASRRTVLDALVKPTVQEVTQLARALEDDTTYGPSSLLPQLRNLQLPLDFWQSFITTVHSRVTSLISKGWKPEAFTAFLKSLLEVAIMQTKIDCAQKPTPPPPQSYYWHGRYRMSSAPTSVLPSSGSVFGVVRDLLTLCIETGNTPLAYNIFHAIFAHHTKKTFLDYMLIPLFPVVLDVLKAHRLTPDTVPFNAFFCQGVVMFIGVLGAKPTGSTTSPCTCEDCNTVNVLLASLQNDVSWPAGQHRRLHVATSLCSLPGLTLSTVTVGSPHSLRIIKSPAFSELVLWKTRSDQGLKLLESVGSDAVWQKMCAEREGLTNLRKALRGELISHPTNAQDLASSSTSNAAPAALAPPAAPLRMPPAGNFAARAPAPLASFPPTVATGLLHPSHLATGPTTVPQKRKHAVGRHWLDG